MELEYALVLKAYTLIESIGNEYFQ